MWRLFSVLLTISIQREESLLRSLDTTHFNRIIKNDSTLPPPAFDVANLKTASVSRRCDTLLVDLENVRGKSGFALSHSEIMDSLAAYTAACGLQGKVTLVIDHGSEATAYWLPDRGFSIVFAGPTRKADDVIASDLVPFFSKQLHHDVVVVTADMELVQRCKRATSTSTHSLHLMSPTNLLDDLEKLNLHMDTWSQHQQQSVATPPVEANEGLESDLPKTPQQTEASLVKLEYEIKLGGELLEAESILRTRSGVNNKRRKKLKKKAEMLREKLAKNGPSMLNRVTDILDHGRNSATLTGFGQTEQNALLSRWEKVRRTSNRREKTGDRVILAEKLRRELEEAYGSLTADMDISALEGIQLPPLHSYFRTVSANSPKLSASGFNSDPVVVQPPLGALRLVVVSDTHGFEDDLTINGPLPDGDILLHLGDFAIDHGPIKEKLRQFDTWLSQQPHKTKIVVRGNHDPRTIDFPRSGAAFINKPTTIMLGTYTFVFVPYVNKGMLARCLPRRCDVIATHVPPEGILDRCYTGKNAGSRTLRKGAEKMTGGPPALWLCGHIHESRGSVRTVFCGDKETLVINAANADSGRATRIEHGPVIVQINQTETGSSKTEATLVSMENQYLFLNKKDARFFADGAKPDVKKLLLAVDLGLRTGVCLFNEEGKLLRYDNFQFETVGELREAASWLLENWEDYINQGGDTANGAGRWAVTHIAIEGGDPPLRDAWAEAADGRCAVLSVKPEEWRADLLITKEKITGEHAKAASRLIARQIVADYGEGMELHDGKFQTDMAESVLLGLHVARRLGWITRSPAIRRYTNGRIIVPDSFTE